MVWLRHDSICFRFCYPVSGFYFGNLGSDCSVSEIVLESEECRTAGAQLGRGYGGSHELIDHPAGCFYLSTVKWWVYFNSYGPSDTQNIDPRAGGVCKKGTSDILWHLFCNTL